MKTNIVTFPFDLFGGGGAAAGAQLLADAVKEMFQDNKRERVPTRARAYQKHVQLQELDFVKLSAYQNWRPKARQAIRRAWQSGDFLMWIAGNHLGVLPIYEELSKHYSKALVVQFDAHLDIYNLSDCTAELSHGNFLLHCQGDLPAIVNVGHRELLLRPPFVSRYYQRAISAAELTTDLKPALAHLRKVCAEASHVFVDIDCDVFDPAFFPAVGHSLPFGLAPLLLLRLLEAVWSGKVVGLALSEFDPARDINDRSLATLVWLVEFILLKRHEKQLSGATQASVKRPTKTS